MEAGMLFPLVNEAGRGTNPKTSFLGLKTSKSVGNNGRYSERRSQIRGDSRKPANDAPVAAYVFGPGHSSLVYRKKKDAPHTDVELAEIVRNEMFVLASGAGSGRGGGAGGENPRKRWNTSEIGARMAEQSYDFSYTQKKRGYTTDELETSFTDYAYRKAKLEEERYTQRWDMLFMLQRMMQEDRPLGSPQLQLAGEDGALYEQIFKAEPRLFIERARFITVMRIVCGFSVDRATDNAQQNGVVRDSTETLHRLNKVFDAFDPLNRNELDWRGMLFMLRVTMDAQQRLDENLRWGFAIYGSEGSFDKSCEDSVRLRDLKEMLLSMVKYEKRQRVNDLFESVWLEVVDANVEANRLVQNASKRNVHLMDIKISLRLFEKMLNSTDFRTMSFPARNFGWRDRRVWTYRFEEEYVNERLLALLMGRRREMRNDRETYEFMQKQRERTLRLNMRGWKLFLARRNRARLLMTTVASRFLTGSTVSGFFGWRRLTMLHVAAEHVQRVFRGYFARGEARFLRSLTRRVTRLQAMWRGLSQRRQFLSWAHRRDWGAAEIQRIMRGFLARRRTARLLEKKFDRVMRELDAESVEIELAFANMAAVKIQTLWRGRQARRHYVHQKDAMVLKARLEKEMEVMDIRHEREKEVYKQELKEWYVQRKEKHLQETRSDKHTIDEKYKLIRLQRRQETSEREKKKQRLQSALERSEEMRVEQWLRDWSVKADLRAEEKRAYLQNIVQCAQTKPEKDLKAELMKRMKEKSKGVMKLGDEQGAMLEWNEAEKIALQGVYLEYMEEEKLLVKEEMRAAAEKYEEEKRLVREEQERKQEAFRLTHIDSATRTIQRMYHTWSANREVRRRAQKIYLKRFDAEAGAYFYENTIIGTTLWHKPTGLGGFDVAPEDQWVLMFGSYGLPYYYNPATFEMEWEQPEGCIFCSVDNPAQCPRFAERRCNVDRAFYCQDCYRQRHFGEGMFLDPLPLTFKQVPGHLTNKCALLLREDGAKLEQLPDMVAIPPPHMVAAPEDTGGSDSAADTAALDEGGEGSAGPSGHGEEGVSSYEGDEGEGYEGYEGYEGGYGGPGGTRDLAFDSSLQEEYEGEYGNATEPFGYETQQEAVAGRDYVLPYT